jgi:hypothetical protein
MSQESSKGNVVRIGDCTCVFEKQPEVEFHPTSPGVQTDFPAVLFLQTDSHQAVDKVTPSP